MVNNPIGKDGYGKGSLMRPVDWTKYNINYDAVYNSPSCELCGQLMGQWRVGQRIFYCRNKDCEMYLVKIGKGD